jgi:hypothetical protein
VVCGLALPYDFVFCLSHDVFLSEFIAPCCLLCSKLARIPLRFSVSWESPPLWSLPVRFVFVCIHSYVICTQTRFFFFLVCLVIPDLGAAYGTAKSGVGISSMGVMKV